MKFIATIIIPVLSFLVVAARKSPGELLDANLEEISNKITTLQSLNQELTMKYEFLRKEINIFKGRYGSCAPCLEVNGYYSYCDCTMFAAKKDCLEFHQYGFKVNGIYNLKASRFSTINAYCDQTTQGGGWTVIQRRQDGSINFDRTWDEYKNGFGNLAGEFWFGNENIYELTKPKLPDRSTNSQLLINMKIHGTNKEEYARYLSFGVSDEQSKYTLTISGFSGSLKKDTMAAHNNRKFTTKDQDNDRKRDGNCAVKFSGGWWHSNCFNINLNGIYGFTRNSSELWWHGKQIQPSFVEMKIRRN